jgi:hypothetical protein
MAVRKDRELSQLAAGGITNDGWDNFDAGLIVHALRIRDNPRSGGKRPRRAGPAYNNESSFRHRAKKSFTFFQTALELV